MKKLGILFFILLVNGVQATPLSVDTLQNNLSKTKKLYSSLLGSSPPDRAGLTLFATMLPKGGDLHHHFSGSIYVESYLDWVKDNKFCVFKMSNPNLNIQKFHVFTEPQKLSDAQRAICLSVDEVLRDNIFYRELLMEWSSKDFANHFHAQTPPDTHFFDTFKYFEKITPHAYGLGLQQLKARAKAENVSYLETMLKIVPATSSSDLTAIFKKLDPDPSDLQIQTTLAQAYVYLQNDKTTNEKIDDYLESTEKVSSDLEDADFRLRFIAYAVRLTAPEDVFSRLYGAFVAANRNSKIVGVNIVGPENNNVAMRDYALHMKMFAFLKKQYPNVKLSLHAGELALGMVPPEGLRSHINQAVLTAGASRIGHGVDIAHEKDAPELLNYMARHQIALEINLTSNKDILGIERNAHPISIYRRFKVPFVISTDDSGVSRNNLSDEYVIYIQNYRPSYEELKSTVYNSIRYSFLTDTEKQNEIKKLNQKFSEFEAQMAMVPQ